MNRGQSILYSDKEVGIATEAGPLKEVGSTMTKYYTRHAVNGLGGIKRTNAFVVGLADFACLGFQRFDLAGYPYEDENAALYSDWVRLGQDIEEARKAIETNIVK